MTFEHEGTAVEEVRAETQHWPPLAFGSLCGSTLRSIIRSILGETSWGLCATWQRGVAADVITPAGTAG